MTITPNWETEIDTPATVAVIGGGAIGIEAALYARFLGYYVLLIEGAKMAQSWRTGAHLPMLLPFEQAASPLGLGALSAHRPDTVLPDLSATLTGLEFAEKYLVPLARTDLLIDSVQVHSRVMSVSRIEARRESPGDIQDRADIEYRLAVFSKNRGWYSERADIILDCSGVGIPQLLGPGGGLAMGQSEQTHVIDTGLPDLSGKQRAAYAGGRIVLVGTSHAALRNLIALKGLIDSEPTTKVTWLVPLDNNQSETSDWLERIAASGEVGRRLAATPEIQQALNGTLRGVATLPGLGIERMISTPEGLMLTIQTNEDSTLDVTCDRVLSNTGWQADWEHARPLRVGESTLLGTPAPWLLSNQSHTSEQLAEQGNEEANSGQFSGDSTPKLSGAEVLKGIVTMEPHYYVLGSKSFGLDQDRFTLAHGHQQIRRAFALIGGREDLDLYTNIKLGG